MSGMDRLDELLPCPFCGGEASGDGQVKYTRPPENCTWDNGDPITEAFFCNCTRCSISNKGHLHGYRTREKAIAAWNRRASQAAPGGCGYPCGYDCNGACFQAAPAPSDVLREALRVLDDLIAEYQQDAWADAEDGEWTGERPDLYDHGISVPYATLSVIRAALSASPAQEGDRLAKPVCPICKGHSRFDQCSCHYEARHD